MIHRRSVSPSVSLVLLSALLLAGCASSRDSQVETPVVAPVPVLPPAYSSAELVGRYGLAAFHKPEDQARTENAARSQCRQPYVISMGPTGGVMMHLADQATPEELRLKGGPGGKTYIGPVGEPGGMQDREIISFDGRVMLTRWIDPEVQGRYGTSVYVRCGAEGTKPASTRAKPKPAPKPKAS
jgi:hypothetical protein